MTGHARRMAARLWWAETASLVRLGLPIVLTNLGQIAIQTTDVVMIGWLGAQELAASALGANVYVVLLLFATGVVQASAPMIAQDLGRRRHAVREPRRTVRQGLWAAALLSLPAWLLLWQIGPLLGLLGQAPALIPLAEAYVHAMMWGFLPALWFVVQRNFIATLERPRAALVVMAGGILFNALADYALIFGRLGLPALGLPGAGLATAATNLLLVLALQLYLARERRFRRYRLLGRFWRQDWPRLAELLRLGPADRHHHPARGRAVRLDRLPDGLAGACGAGGAPDRAAMRRGRIHGAARPRPGRHGPGRPRGRAGGWRRQPAGGLVALALGLGFMAAMAVPMWTVPEVIVGWFLDRADPANAGVVPLAATFLAIAAWFQIVDGGQVIGAGLLRGLKDTRWPMIMAAFAYFGVGLGATSGLAFGLGLGGQGIWLGLAVALAVAAVLMIGRFLRLTAQPAGDPGGDRPPG